MDTWCPPRIQLPSNCPDPLHLRRLRCHLHNFVPQHLVWTTIVHSHCHRRRQFLPPKPPLPEGYSYDVNRSSDPRQNYLGYQSIAICAVAVEKTDANKSLTSSGHAPGPNKFLLTGVFDSSVANDHGSLCTAGQSRSPIFGAFTTSLVESVLPALLANPHLSAPHESRGSVAAPAGA